MSGMRKTALSKRMRSASGLVGPFGLGDDLRLDPRRVVLADLVLDRGRNEDVAVELEELGVRDPLRPGKPGHRARLSLVRVDAIRVETLRVRDRPARVREA